MSASLRSAVVIGVLSMALSVLANGGAGPVLFERLKTFGYPEKSGTYPAAALVQDANGVLYGTTVAGGSSAQSASNVGPGFGYGTVFKLEPDDQGHFTYSAIKIFNGGADGAYPYCSLALGPGGVLYGTTHDGGTQDQGTLFKLSPAGSGYSYSVLKNFGSADGSHPHAGVTRGPDGTLYGTTVEGGTFGSGTVFRLGADETTFAVIANLADIGVSTPAAALLLGADGSLYGTALDNGNDGGCVFKLNTDGTGAVVLHTYLDTGADESFPYAGLIQCRDGALYGTTHGSPANNGGGTVFRLNPDGSGYQVLWTFTPPQGFSRASLVQTADGSLYGTASTGQTITIFNQLSSDLLFKLTPNGSGGFDYGVVTTFGNLAPSGYYQDPNDPLASILSIYDTTSTLMKSADGSLYLSIRNRGPADHFTLDHGEGAVSKLTPDGNGGYNYTVVWNFAQYGGDGANSFGLTQAADGTLYGTTEAGGNG